MILTFFAVIVYMIEQRYIFQVGTLFIWVRDWTWYLQNVRTSSVFVFVLQYQNIIIPLAVVLMVYKLFLSNLISAVVMTIIYNLSHVGFYKKKDSWSYRVEFHEVGGGDDDAESDGESTES